MREAHVHSGQAMVETAIAVVLITFFFFGLFGLSRLLTAKIMVEHAAMRVARARAVGFGKFMCRKAARVAAIPACGKRLHPDSNDERGEMDTAALARMYMRTIDSSYADALLQYEHWGNLTMRVGSGDGASSVSLKTELGTVRGEARVDAFPVYMNDEGQNGRD